VVEHGQVERLEQLLFDPVGQARQGVAEQGRGVQQAGVPAVVVGLAAQGGELAVDVVAFGFQVCERTQVPFAHGLTAGELGSSSARAWTSRTWASSVVSIFFSRLRSRAVCLSRRAASSAALAGNCWHSRAARSGPNMWVAKNWRAVSSSDGGVMAGQLGHLIEAAASPRITVQVMPFAAAAHPGMLGPFVVASFESDPDAAYLDNALAGQVTERRKEVSRVSLALRCCPGPPR
jgi:hypothetical protein